MENIPYKEKAPAIAAINEYLENNREESVISCLADLFENGNDFVYDATVLHRYVFACKELVVLLTKPSVLEMIPCYLREKIGKQVVDMMSFFGALCFNGHVQAELDLFGTKEGDGWYRTEEGLEKTAERYKKELLAKNTSYKILFGERK